MSFRLPLLQVWDPYGAGGRSGPKRPSCGVSQSEPWPCPCPYLGSLPAWVSISHLYSFHKSLPVSPRLADMEVTAWEKKVGFPPPCLEC